MNRTILHAFLATLTLALLLPTEAQAMYHPRLGRFLQRDPIGYGNGVSLYVYVGTGPIGRADPMGLWGIEFHKGVTTELARRAGYNCPEFVGSCANAPDEDITRSAPHLTAAATAAALARRFEVAWALLKRAAEWHFPADPDGEVRPGSTAAESKVNQAMEDCDLLAFSEGLHVLQDSYSHQGKPPVFLVGHTRGKRHRYHFVEEQSFRAPDWKPNPWEPPSGRGVTITEPLTGLEAAQSHSADNPFDYPASARAAALKTYEWLLKFREKCPCACPRPDTSSCTRSGVTFDAVTAEGDPARSPAIETWLVETKGYAGED